MALYEHVLVARQDISPQQVDALLEDVTKIVTEQGGKIAKSEYWGLRNLAFRVRKNRKGHYCLVNIDGPAATVQELERRHRINEDIIRFLTIRVEEHDEEPSPVLARRDRDERRRNRRDGERDDRDGDLEN
jgi:small subunit ribosomal protein S6